jgi:pyruvate formate lyase activating enzyme
MPVLLCLRVGFARKNELIDGIVLCGGEPTISKEIIPLIKKIKKMGFSVKLDTNGSDPKLLKTLIDQNLVDYVAMDIKGPKEKYNDFSGVKVDVKKIQKSIDILKEGKVDYEFRSTIVSTLHKKEDIIEMAKWIKGAKKYFLQNFKPEKTIDPEFEKIKPYPQEFLLKIQKIIAPFFEVCQVR